MMCRIPVLLALFLMLLLQPLTADAAKTLASKAIETALEEGTFKEVQQELMMDLHQKRKFDFDEAGVEALGRRLLTQGQSDTAIEVLQLNQVLHSDSAGAAVAIADAYQESGQSTVAQVYYEKALDLDPGNRDARRGLQESDSDGEGPMMGATSDWDLDPEAMQESMAQMGMEVSPEQMAEMQEAMEQLQQMQAGGGLPQASKASQPASSTSRASQPAAASEPAHESEFCEVLHRFNSDKKIPDAGVRARYEGEYGSVADAARNKTWNVETACREFLVAVPLWADVSPPVLAQKGGTRFEDAMGGSWLFEIDSDGKAKGVTLTAKDGTTSEMKRLGSPRSYD
jgi:hypothetical protein